MIEPDIFIGDDWIELRRLDRGTIRRLTRNIGKDGRFAELIPGMDSVALVFDPDDHDVRSLTERVREFLQSEPRDKPISSRQTYELPICCDPDCGPDLALIAEGLGLAESAVPDWLADQQYEVAMLGFQPGFAYLEGVGETALLPRLETARQSVAAGSVGCRGAQCGVYPFEGPGGWPVVGRTPTRLFDPSKTPAALLLPGMKIAFRLISRDEFDGQANALK